MRTTAQQPHILLIDGAVSNLDVMRRVLEREGCRVSVFSAPPEPARLVELAPDVIVQELRFHQYAEIGWSALTSMQLTPALAGIPVILCTTDGEALMQPANAAVLAEFGVRVVLKPFRIEEFCAVIADALVARRLLGQVNRSQSDGRGPGRVLCRHLG